MDAFEGMCHDVGSSECFEVFVVLHCSANISIGDYANTVVIIVN